MTAQPSVAKANPGMLLQWDATDLMRRHMYWLAPLTSLFSALPLYGISKTCAALSVAAAVLSIPAGLTFRWLQSARAVLLIWSVFAIWSLVLLYGVVVPLAYLALTNREAWMPWFVMVMMGVLLGFMSFRVRRSLAVEWAGSLEGNPEIDLDREERRVRRMILRREEPVLIGFALAAMVVLLPAVYLTRATPAYSAVALLLAPQILAFMTVDVVARWIAFYLALRRWEVRNGIRLRFPALPSQKEKERQIRKIARLNRRRRG